jgi:hypothetical protein
VNWWSPVWPVTGIGLTGAGPEKLLAGDPAPVPGWPGTLLFAVWWPDTNGRVTRGWPNFNGKWWFGVKGYERLNTFQLINHLCVVTKFGMSLTKFLIEQSALFEKFKMSLALFKGELITTLESLVGPTISSSDLVASLVCASQCELLISISSKKGISKS